MAEFDMQSGRMLTG